MKKINNLHILLLLYTLTLLLAWLANKELPLKTAVILLLSACKFLLVAFYFMEMHKAHIFWKAMLLLYVLFFGLLVGGMLL